MGFVHVQRECTMLRLNGTLETLDIDDVFFETKQFPFRNNHHGLVLRHLPSLTVGELSEELVNNSPKCPNLPLISVSSSAKHSNLAGK